MIQTSIITDDHLKLCSYYQTPKKRENKYIKNYTLLMSKGRISSPVQTTLYTITLSPFNCLYTYLQIDVRNSLAKWRVEGRVLQSFLPHLRLSKRTKINDSNLFSRKKATKGGGERTGGGGNKIWKKKRW